MNCPKCGNPLVSNMNFCTKCGTPVPQKPTAPQQPVGPQATVMPQQPVNKTQQAPARPKEFLQYDAPKKQPQNVVKPQPPKQPVQPTYPQNNPPKVQPQPAPQSVVTPQPAQQNVAIQSPKPPKEKKSNKNLPLIIVAAVLVLAVLASTIAVVPGIIRNKNEINAATEYIEEFPTLKQRTSLLVYDINKFPSEKYEIKVEKMFMGGVLNGVFKGKTILEDVSTEQIYDIDFKEDGDYRITLTDKTEPTESTETEVIELVIIIDVKVDNDAEDAVDSVDIHSPENPAVQYLEATQEDFDLLAVVLSDVCGWTDEYKPENPDANKIAVNSMLALFNDGYRSCAEKYGLESPEGIYNTKSQDPLKRYASDDYSGYYKYPEDEVNWLIKNMFNVEPKETESWETYSYDDGTEETVCLWYNQDGYYYSYFIVTGADVINIARIDDSSRLENGTYDISVTMLQSTMYEETDTPIGNYKVVAGLKDVDGKRVWTFYEWREAESEEETSSVTQPTEPVTESEPKNTYEKNARMYNDYLINGGLETLLEESYMQDVKIKIETCLLDINDDGVYELLLRFTDTEHIGVKGYITNDFLFGIQNGQVIRLAWESYGGGSMGGSHLYVRYDTVDKKHCVYFENIMYDGVWAVTAERAELEYKGNRAEKNTLYETESYLLDSQYDTYDKEIERIKNGIGLYKIADDNSRIYAYYCNGKNISETEHNKNTTERYITPTDEKYLMKEGSHENPLAI